ncbi:unnamed protein product [Camellia sinensis]
MLRDMANTHFKVVVSVIFFVTVFGLLISSEARGTFAEHEGDMKQALMPTTFICRTDQDCKNTCAFFNCYGYSCNFPKVGAPNKLCFCSLCPPPSPPSEVPS